MAQTDREATLAAATIEKLHNLIVKDLSESEAFRSPVVIEEMGSHERGYWERLREPVTFLLRTKEKADRMRVVVDPETGQRQAVVRLEPGAGANRSYPALDWWIAWSEEWSPSGQIRKQYEFTFEKAAWRLYCTDENDTDTLLVRAEWDRPDKDNPQNAAQPHWHVHHQQKVGIANDRLVPKQAESMVTGVSALLDQQSAKVGEEMQSQGEDESNLIIPLSRWIEITGIHLGMAGWYNEGAHPRCWQSPFRDLQQTIRRWAVATIEYMCTQLCYVRLRQAEAS
jgi:hypothetical protein